MTFSRRYTANRHRRAATTTIANTFVGRSEQRQDEDGARIVVAIAAAATAATVSTTSTSVPNARVRAGRERASIREHTASVCIVSRPAYPCRVPAVPLTHYEYEIQTDRERKLKT